MEIAQIVLDFLRILFSWPVVIGVLLYLFFREYRPEIGRLIERIRRLAFPGGELAAENYPIQPPERESSSEASSEASPPQPQSVKTAEVEDLAKDFDSFLWEAISLNRTIIQIMIDHLWNKKIGSMAGAGAQPATTLTEKMHQLRKISDIPSGATRDLSLIENVTRQISRQELLLAHRRSEALVWYVTRGIGIG